MRESRHGKQHAPDGSPIGFYALFPPQGEPELIHALLSPGAVILELGCGAGRITHPLIALGHPVVAVDQSAAMLAHVRDAETVLSEIETLDLGRAFPVVLLASNLINTEHDAQRDAFLHTCRRHVAPDGVVILQRIDPVWAANATDAEAQEGEVHTTLRDVRHNGRLLSAVSEYRIGDRVWTHPWTMRILDDAEIEAALATTSLRVQRYLGPNRTWITAMPATSARRAHQTGR
ncbi:MAG: class I SAM-dependent methyltransferase [Dehalococcoidia bacterium]